MTDQPINPTPVQPQHIVSNPANPNQRVVAQITLEDLDRLKLALSDATRNGNKAAIDAAKKAITDAENRKAIEDAENRRYTDAENRP